MEAGILENYCLSEYLLSPFRTICVRNYTSWFSAVLPFLTMAVLHLLGLPTWPQIFFLRYKCKRSNITLSHVVKNLAHSKSCPCNHECRPTARWGGRAAVCSMVFGSGTGAVEGWAFRVPCGTRRAALAAWPREAPGSAAARGRPAVPALLSPRRSTQLRLGRCSLQWLLARRTFTFSQHDCKLETCSQLLFLSRGNKFHLENLIFLFGFSLFSFWKVQIVLLFSTAIAFWEKDLGMWRRPPALGTCHPVLSPMPLILPLLPSLSGKFL